MKTIDPVLTSANPVIQGQEDAKNSYSYRQSFYLGGDGSTALHRFLGEAAARMANKRTREEIQSMQSALDEVSDRHRSSMLKSFKEEHPEVDLDAFWSIIKDTRQSKSANPKLLPLRDESTVADFINVTAWVASNEGAERGDSMFPVNKINYFVGKNSQEVLRAVEPATFPAKCAVCGEDAIAYAYSASVRREIFRTKIVCSHCHHVASAVPSTTLNGMKTLGSFIDSIDCECQKCSEDRKWLTEEAASRAKDLIQSSINQICKESHERRFEGIPLVSEIKPGSEKVINTFEDGLFKLGMSLEETLNSIVLARAGGFHCVHIEDVVDEGLHHGYLKASKVTLLADDLDQEVVKVLNLAWDGNYSLTQLESDLVSGDAKLILNGLGKFCDLKTIQSPYVAIVHYQA